MFVRVVRFTGVSPERVEGTLARIAESDGPPPGVATKRLQMMFDPDQETAIVIQHFDSAEDMAAGAAVLEAMDAGETPGTRVSVDAGELKVDITPD